MRLTLYEWMLLPFILWGVFQGALYFNANQVEQAIHHAMYEGAKVAAVEGRFSADIYDEMLVYLEKVHKFDPSKVHIEGTEQRTFRGEHLKLEVVVPKPRIHVIPLFKPDEAHDYKFEKFIMSEYVSNE